MLARPDAETMARTIFAGEARADAGSGEREVVLTFSSEAPVLRDFGYEILGHADGEADFSRVDGAGVPFLLDHRRDLRNQVGRVRRAWIEAGRGRAIVRLSDTAAGREMLARIRDGEVSAVSVGYELGGRRGVSEIEGVRAIRFAWTLLEISAVAVPADASVGIGRSIGHATTKGNTMEHKTETPARPKAEDPVQAERCRIGEITAMADNFGIDRAMVADAIAKGTSVDAFGRQCLDVVGGREADIGPSGHTLLDLRSGSAADRRILERYSLARAVRAEMTGDWGGAGLEREMHQELRRVGGRGAEGVMVPDWAVVPRKAGRRDLIDSTAGAELLGTTHMGSMFVDALRPATIVGRLGGRILTGNTHDIAIPKLSAGTASEWIVEDAAATESVPSLGTLSAQYHHLSVRASYSRRMIVQSEPAIEEILRSDMLRELAIAVDRAALIGSGTAGQPRGIINTVGVGSVAMGTDGGAPTWSKVLEFVSAVETQDAGGSSMGWAINPSTKSALMSTTRDTGSGSFCLDGDARRMAGFPVETSTILPNDGTKGTGTALSTIVFGNWNDLYLVQFGGLEIIVDKYSQSEKGNVRIAMHSHWDVMLRHPEAFAVASDVVA